MTATLLKTEGLFKNYAGATAVDDVSLEIHGGQVHALVGANGAGKSTFIKMLSGDVRRSGGEISLNGRTLDINSPQDALEAGIVTIYQDLTVAGELTVAQNVVLGAEPRLAGVRGFVSHSAAVRTTEKILDVLGAKFSPNAKASELTYAERQLVSIGRALAQECQVMILDEPTASLTLDATEHLHRTVRTLQSQGKAILYISHHLEEIRQLAQTISVMRDGRHVATLDAKAVETNEIIRLMVGDVQRKHHGAASKLPAAGEVSSFRVESVSRAPAYRDISFAVASGEIVGIAGVPGSGREALTRSLVGELRPDSGQLLLDGVPQRFTSARKALRNGVMYLPGDRGESGLALNLSLRENLLLPPGSTAARRGFRRLGAETKTSRELLQTVSCQPANPDRLAGTLSGGNQQRLLFARALYVQPKVLVIDDPTQGVDVKGRADIHQLIREFAAQGVAVVLASSEFDELEETCDRILVMRAGQAAGWIEPHQYGGDAILSLALSA